MSRVRNEMVWSVLAVDCFHFMVMSILHDDAYFVDECLPLSDSKEILDFIDVFARTLAYDFVHNIKLMLCLDHLLISLTPNISDIYSV